MNKSQLKKALKKNPLGMFDCVVAGKDGKTFVIFRGANPLAPLFPAETQVAFRRIDEIQKNQPNPMR